MVEVGQALSYSGDEEDGGGAGVGSGGDVDGDGEIYSQGMCKDAYDKVFNCSSR